MATNESRFLQFSCVINWWRTQVVFARRQTFVVYPTDTKWKSMSVRRSDGSIASQPHALDHCTNGEVNDDMRVLSVALPLLVAFYRLGALVKASEAVTSTPSVSKNITTEVPCIDHGKKCGVDIGSCCMNLVCQKRSKEHEVKNY